MQDKTYPHRNPFPCQGTRSLEGVDTDVDETSGQWPTLETRAIKDTLHVVTAYVDHFASKGQPLALVGAHGSGKTHAIFYVRDRLNKLASRQITSSQNPFQIYVKAEGPDFVFLYREITKTISLATFRGLSERLLASVAGKQAGKDLQNREAIDSIKQGLRDDPSLVARLFQDYVVEEGAVESSRAKEVIQIAGGRHDFHRALSFLLSDHLAETAHAWFVGQPISLDDARKLGVSGSITSPDMAKWALQLIATLFHRAERPFVLCIDQFEKLVLGDKDKSLLSQNAGLLHSLVEVVPREHGLLVLSGSEQAWTALPTDLRQRFADCVVRFPVLTFDEARELISVYLRSSSAPAGASPSDAVEDPLPFCDGAVREMLRYGGGNIRRLLQMCSVLFDEASSEHRTIDAGFTAEILRCRGQTELDEEKIGQDVARLLSTRGFRIARQFRLKKAVIDFAVLDADDQPRCFIQIAGAIFHNDEARHALRSLELARDIRGLEVPPPLILVVAGYVSPEVLETVQRIAQEVVVYRPESFEERFGQVLEGLAKAAPARTIDLIERERINEQFAELRDHLEKLLRSRDDEARVTNERVTNLLRQQDESREQERLQQVRRDWAQERAQIEERIKQSRQQQKAKELDELERLREHAQLRTDDRLKRMALIIGGVISLYFIGFAVWFWLPDMSYKSSLFDRHFLILVIGCLPGILALLRPDILTPFFRLYVPSARDVLRFRELAGPCSSLEELKRVALAAASEAGLTTNSELADYRFKRWIESDNPHFRYAAIHCSVKRRVGINLKRQLERERSAVLRRLLSRCLADDASSWGRQSEDVEALANLLRTIPETVYLIEGIARRDLIPKEFYKHMPAPHRLLADWLCPNNLVESPVGQNGTPNSLVLELAQAKCKEPSSQRSAVLLRAFEADLDELPRLSSDAPSSQEIRQAVRELSPFDNNGLGTFDELQDIDTIDRFYLFFRHLQFLKERGVLLVSPNSPPVVSPASS